MQTHPSLRFQAHLAFPQGLPSVQKCQKSLQARPTPTHGHKDCVAKIKDRLTDDKNGQLVTACIVHLADSANIKGVTHNKRCSGLTGLCFESPNDTIHVTVANKFKKDTA